MAEIARTKAYTVQELAECASLVKVGYSGYPLGRAKSMKTANPFRLELIGDTPGTRVTERIIHKAFGKWHYQNEWFRATPAVMRAIKELCDD